MVRTSATALVFALGYLAGTAHTGTDRELRAAAGSATSALSTEISPAADRVFELRTYTAAEGKHEALLARFRDHTMRIFEKHRMENVGYWTPQDAPDSENTLVYVIAHDSREQAAASWEAFIADPEWQSVAEASQREGRLITGLESVFMDPTDFSPLR